MLLGDDGFGSWPPDLFGPADWPQAPIITIQDEFYLADQLRKWTTAERKYALIIRDPLTYRYDRKLLEWLKDQSNENLSGEVNNLHQELEIKWRFRIYIPRVVMDNVEEALSRIERGFIIRPWRPKFAQPQKVHDLRRHPGHLITDRKTHQIIISTGYEDNGLIYCPPPLIPIAIDPTMLTLRDAERVMKAVWNMVKPEIKKLQDGKGPGWTPVAPGGEPEALAEVLRCRPANFEKYLWWYDLHTEEDLAFRVIALLESTISTIEDPERWKAIFEKMIGGRKPTKIRKKVKGESAVRKGHDLIQFAIHRKKRLDAEDKLPPPGGFKCPVHEGINNCPLDCEYLVKWWKDRTKQFKDSCPQEIPYDPATLEALLHKSITE
jgi:hypothetical protein